MKGMGAGPRSFSLTLRAVGIAGVSNKAVAGSGCGEEVMGPIFAACGGGVGPGCWVDVFSWGHARCRHIQDAGDAACFPLDGWWQMAGSQAKRGQTGTISLLLKIGFKERKTQFS